MEQRKGSPSQTRLGVCSISCMDSRVRKPKYNYTSLLTQCPDASDFLRKHPWPGRAISDTFDDSTHRQGGVSKRFFSALKVICGRTGDSEDVFDDPEYEDEQILFDEAEDTDPNRPFYWSPTLQQSFREELEKCVEPPNTSFAKC